MGFSPDIYNEAQKKIRSLRDTAEYAPIFADEDTPEIEVEAVYDDGSELRFDVEEAPADESAEEVCEAVFEAAEEVCEEVSEAVEEVAEVIEEKTEE